MQDQAVLERNLDMALTAYQRLADSAGLVNEGGQVDAGHYAYPAWIDVPVEQARISAPVIHAALTSEAVKTGLGRTLRPVIDDERCNRCWWICSSLCPVGAIRVADGQPSIDYDHCKGCLVCVAVCPPHAIEARPESDETSAEGAR